MASIVIDGIHHEADFDIDVKINPQSDFEKERLCRLEHLEIHDVPVFILGRIEFKGISKDDDGDHIHISIHPN